MACEAHCELNVTTKHVCLPLAFRRRSFTLFKNAHHIGFWGFLLAGCAHHWSLFWAFLPGLILYAVDGVFRLHQALLSTGVDLAAAGTTASAADGWPPSSRLASHTEVLHIDVDGINSSGSTCSLLLAAPQFAAAPSGTVWINVPAMSLTAWKPFDYTALQVEAAGGGNSSGCCKAGCRQDPHRSSKLSFECDAHADVGTEEQFTRATRSGLLLHIKGNRLVMLYGWGRRFRGQACLAANQVLGGLVSSCSPAAWMSSFTSDAGKNKTASSGVAPVS